MLRNSLLRKIFPGSFAEEGGIYGLLYYKYPDKSFSAFEDLRGFENLAGLMFDSYLRIYVRVLIELLT
jgi:hypothetical protein